MGMRVFFSQNKGRHGWHDWLFDIFSFQILEDPCRFSSKVEAIIAEGWTEKNENKAKL